MNLSSMYFHVLPFLVPVFIAYIADNNILDDGKERLGAGNPSQCQMFPLLLFLLLRALEAKTIHRSVKAHFFLANEN